MIYEPHMYASRLHVFIYFSSQTQSSWRSKWYTPYFCQEDLSIIVRFIVTHFHSLSIVHPHCRLRNYASPSHLALCLIRSLGVPFINKTSSTLYRGLENLFEHVFRNVTGWQKTLVHVVSHFVTVPCIKWSVQSISALK